MNLTRKNWPLGYVPSQDEINGSPEALVRMDNLTLNELGIVSLTRGTSKVNTTAFPGLVHSIYSQTSDTIKWRFAGLGDGSTIWSKDNFVTISYLPSTGSNQRAVFTTAFGMVFISSSLSRYKLRLSTNTTTLWGLLETYAPTIVTSAGTNNGKYEWAIIEVEKQGDYTAFSQLSPPSTAITLANTFANVTYSVRNNNISELWLYRRSAEVDPNITPPSEPRRLDQWYRVKIESPSGGGTFTGGANVTILDDTSDDDALLDGETVTHFTSSIRPVGSLGIQDEILGMTGVVNGARVFIMTIGEIIPTTPFSVDSYDTNQVFRLSGDSTEKNLWIQEIDFGRIIVGTTSDIYEITGTFADLPDGSLNIQVRALGVGKPPICESKVVDSGIVFYIAADGVRAIRSSDSTLISPVLDLLWNGETRYGIPPVNVVPNNNGLYPLGIHRRELYCFLPLTDGTRRGFIYHLDRQTWRYWNTDPVSLYEEEDGTFLGGYGGGSGNFLRVLDTGTLLDGTTGQDVELRTIYDDNQQPRNRKDVFSFKMTANTGGTNITIAIASNGSGSYITIGTIAFTGVQEKIITIADTIGLAKNYSVKITGTGLSTFELYNFTIEYEPRPEQLTYIRIPYNNLNTQSRKRFINYSIVIDTLGTQCEIFPLIDGALAGASSTFTLDRRGTYTHYFTSEQVGIDIGAIICGFFEFYGINAEEIVSEKLPTPTKFLIIPATDYGEPNRKRHSSYKFQLHSRSKNVRFTPKLDGVAQTAATFNTTEKRTVEYFFTSDTIAIDVGGTLETLEDTPFEFYGVIKPQQVEVLPPRLKEFRIPENNYGIAAKKRIRTMPMEINTNGFNVNFIPIIDGVSLPATVLNTPARRTTFHWFDTDVFGVDFSGELTGNDPFEFYGLLRPENVETLPVTKKYDQIGPVSFTKIAKLLAFRVRMIAASLTMPYAIYFEDTLLYSGTIVTQPNKDIVYDVPALPKTLYGTTLRIEFGPASPFNRYYVELKVNESGGQTDARWIKVK